MTDPGRTRLPIVEPVDSVAERLADDRRVGAEPRLTHVLSLGCSPVVPIVERV
jgi:hypothetical protein